MQKEQVSEDEGIFQPERESQILPLPVRGVKDEGFL